MAGVADPLPGICPGADHGSVLGRRVLPATLAPIGAAALLYVVVVRGFLGSSVNHSLGWPLLGVLPTFAFGIWLLTVSASRVAVFIALASTAMAVGSAFETFVQENVELLHQPWFPLLNMAGQTADAVATAASLAMFASYPTGTLERRWQRIAVVFVWLPVLAGPLLVLTTPHLVMQAYSGIDGSAIPNALAVPGLEWAAPAVYYLIYQPWPCVVLGLGLLYSRALFGDAQVRERTRVMTWVVTASLLSFVAWTLVPQYWFTSIAVLASLMAMPVAAIHGIFRYGAFNIAPDDRGRVVSRSSNLLITVLYGIGAATPAVLLSDSLTATGAVLLTTLFAVCLLPLRGWLRNWIHRAVFGDRDRQLTLLSQLGTQLDQAVDPRQLLARLAEAVRDGLDASWVQIRLAGEDGDLSGPPVGVAGEPAGLPVDSCELVRSDETLARIDVGPRRRGDYSDAERALLRTVAGQSTASIANVRLTAQLDRQLNDLTESRERLVAAQDGERKRLERDLHDGIQQNVVAQIAGLRLARNKLQRGELTAGELAALQDQARETLTDLRELAHGIHPPVLSDNGLVAAIESSVARFPIPLTVAADDGVRADRFAEDVETTAYYVVREALANTAKHANASRASVGLVRSGGHLRIMITDDGCGIDALVPASRGGLANIRDRVEALRGKVNVSGNDPSGTTVLVELPVEREAGSSG